MGGEDSGGSGGACILAKGVVTFEFEYQSEALIIVFDVKFMFSNLLKVLLELPNKV